MTKLCFLYSPELPLKDEDVYCSRFIIGWQRTALIFWLVGLVIFLIGWPLNVLIFKRNCIYFLNITITFSNKEFIKYDVWISANNCLTNELQMQLISRELRVTGMYYARRIGAGFMLFGASITSRGVRKSSSRTRYVTVMCRTGEKWRSGLSGDWRACGNTTRSVSGDTGETAGRTKWVLL